MRNNILVFVLACIALSALWVYKHPEEAEQYKTKFMALFSSSPKADKPDEPTAKMTYVEEVRKLDEKEVEFFKLIATGSADDIIAKLTVKNINSKDARDNSVLHHLMGRKDFLTSYKVMEVLFANKVDVNAVNKYGQTALHIAAITNRYQLIPLLLQNGAIHNIRDQKNKRPLDYAGKMGNSLVVDMLKGLK